MWRDAGSLVDMLKAARKVVEYATGLDESSFLANSRDQDAILRQLTIVGEAAKRVSNEFRTSHPEVPWRRVAGFRDVVVHDYFKVDIEEVWRIVQGDVPALIAVIEPLVPPENA
jgi:uncharacterized protein with HEPN domain